MDYYENADFYRSREYAATCPTFQEVEVCYDTQTALLFQQLAAHIPYGLANDIALVGSEAAWMALNAQEIAVAQSIYDRIMYGN